MSNDPKRDATMERARQRRDRKQARRGAKAAADPLQQLDDVGGALGAEIPVAPRRHWKGIIAATVLIGGFGVGFGVCAIVRWRLRVIPGIPVGEVFVHAPAGDTMIVIDHVAIGGGTDNTGEVRSDTADGERLTAIDATTGKQLAVDVTAYRECVGAGPRLWCIDNYERLDVLDPRTLASTATADDLIARAGLAKPTRQRPTFAASEVTVPLSDGRGARIATTDLGVSVIESVPWTQPVTTKHTTCTTMSRIAIGPTTLVLDSTGSRQTLRADPPPPAESATPPGKSLSFLHGGFLSADPPLVLDEVTVDGPHVVTRIEGRDRERWRVPLGGKCYHVARSGKLLVVATDSPDRRAVAIDVDTGAVAWTFGR